MSGQTNTSRPNILFIAVDDLRPQSGCYGKTFMHTPNMDSLAQAGIRFVRSYCQYPLCGPSRTSIMTGMRPNTVKVYSNYTHFRQKVPDAVTLPQHFKNHGYYSIGIGKLYHHTKSMQDPKSWSETPVKYYSNEIQGEYHLKDNINGYQRAEAKAEKQSRKELLKGAPPYEKAELPDTAYQDGKIANEAVSVLERLAKKEDRPFFLGWDFTNRI